MLLSLSSEIFAVEYIVKLNIPEKSNSIQSKFDLVPVFSNTKSLNSPKRNYTQSFLSSELNKYYKVVLDQNQISNFENNFDVISITPNYKYKIEIAPEPNDPRFPSQWALSYLNVRRAWEKSTGQDVIVGVIDTGIDFDHEDLQGQLWINSAEDINNNGTFEPWAFDEERNGVTGDFDFIDNDGNGYPDDVIGFDFVHVSSGNVGDDSEPDPIPYDENSHGTNVSGIISAKHNNGLGISGVAYNSKIMTIRAFDISGEGESDDIAASIVYAVDNGVQVLNFSWGEDYYSPIVHDAIKYAFANNVVMVSSSGNNNWYEEHFPSDLEEVISVGGIAQNFQKSGISNYGNRIDILAPGISINTLEPNNGYTTKSGTSVAAPHVAATAAMILEQKPNLKPNQVKFLLENNANDDNEYSGWDVFYGKGILNINTVLESNTNGTVTVTFPEHNAAINTTDIATIPIVGTISHPLMRSYSFFVRKGRNPFNERDFRSNEPFEEWTLASDRLYDQVVNDTIVRLDKSILEDTVYTVRLKIDLINNSTYEQRFYIRPYRNSIFTKNRFNEQPKALTFFDKDQRKILVTATTKFESNFYVEVYNQSNELINTYSEIERSSLDHSVVLSDLPLEENLSYTAYAVVSDDTLKYNSNLPILNNNVPTSLLAQKPYRIDGLYIHNEIYDEATNSFAATNLIGVNYVGTSYYEFENNRFTKKDSINSPRLIIGYGDSNGDSKKEILTAGNGTLILYEENSNSKFGSVIFEINDRIIWPTDFKDIDNDGKDEIIAHNDTSYFVFDYSNGNFEQKSELTIPIQLGRFDNFMSSIYTNIDDDPETEFIFTNSFGLIFVYEYKNGQFVKEYENLVPISISSQHLIAADIDADGSDEVLILNAGYQIPYNNNSGKDLIWTAQLWDYKDNSFKKIWQEHFSGVNIGGVNFNNDSFKNGVSAGDLDGIAGDEIIISPFPDMYVFTYSDGEIKPIWFYEFALTNEAIVHDFDKNGKNELAFNTIFGTRFFEISDNEKIVNAPANFRGRPVNQTTVQLNWDKEPTAAKYNIYRLINPNTGQGVLYASTTENEISFDTLQNFTWYDFFIVSESSDGISSNAASQLVSCFTHPKANVIQTEFVSPNILELTYDTKMPDYEFEPQQFKLVNADKTIKPSSVISSQNRKLRLIFGQAIYAADFTLSVPPLEDYYRQFTNEYIALVNSNYAGEPKEFYFASGEVVDDRLLVRFSENIDISALQIENYTFLPKGNITDIVAGDSPNEVLISTDALSEDALGIKFTLTGKPEIKSANGNSMTSGAGNVLQFTFFKKDLNEVFAYPQPVKLSKHEFITFANLTPNATIHIYNSNSEYIKSITEFDGDGGANWDLIDINGRKLKSGVYYYKIEGKNSVENETQILKSELQKFMIIE